MHRARLADGRDDRPAARRRLTLGYPSPELEDGIVRLRPWMIGDLECVREAAEDPEIPRWSSVPARFSPEAGRAFLDRTRARRQRGEGFALAIAESDGDRAIGHVWIGVRPQPGVVGLGYWIVPSARRRGVATRATRLATGWALGPGGAARIEAWVLPGNVGSQRVLEAAGFTREGVLRSFLESRGARCDAIVFSRIRAEL